ncbi:MAG: hypothetical protein LUE27_08035 [Clostridia bacterium]|nr:hypothetical protein [Clostridia bacterium]
MDKLKITDGIQPGIRMTRQDICRIALESDSSFKENLIQYLIDTLLKNGEIVRVGRNSYVKVEGNAKHMYPARYSEDALVIIERLKEKFPLMKFQVWELRWLNEFLIHLVWRNTIFIDVEKMGAGFVFDELYDDYKGNILLEPDDNQVFRYSSNGSLVIGKLISEAPQADEAGVTPLERIMVDLVANKLLGSMINEGEIPDIIREMFDKYRVNRSTLMRYARRRHKEDRMREILGDRLDTV